MTLWRRLFGKPQTPTLPAPPVVDELARWACAPASGGAVAVVKYGRNESGELTIEVDGGSPDTAAFIAYYLLDPRNTRPVHVEGLGPRRGPHTQSAEQFDRAMHELPIRNRGWTAHRLT